MRRQRFVPERIGDEAPRKHDVPFPKRGNQHRQSNFTRYRIDDGPAANDSGAHGPSEAHRENAPHETQDADADQHELQLQEAYAQAAEQGYQAGIEQAEQVVQAALDEQLAKVEALLQSLLQLKSQLITEYREQAIELTLAGAEALARRAFDDDRNSVQRLLSEALEELAGPDVVTLHVDEASAAELQTWIAEKFEDSKIRVIGDVERGPADFRAESTRGSITHDFDARVEQLRHALSSPAPKPESRGSP